MENKLTTILMKKHDKKEFDYFCKEWGRYDETQSDIIRRMCKTLLAIEADNTPHTSHSTQDKCEGCESIFKKTSIKLEENE
jgi:hypothetical protein